MQQGLIHIYEGNGKGKTTAAIGLAVRAVGADMHVAFVSFLKDGTSSELRILNALDAVTVFPCKKNIPFVPYMTAGEKEDAKVFYTEQMQTLCTTCNTYDMIILDEVLDAVDVGLVKKSLLLDFLRNRSHRTEVIMTGRHATEDIAAFAHYITEMKAIAHPYDNGVEARLGIEF